MRVALLRGVNVGGHTVRGPVLCDVLTGLGLRRVRSVIASGNLLFEEDPRDDGPEVEDRIAAALEERLGWPVPTAVRSSAELAVVADGPTAARLDATDATLQVGFWKRVPDPDGAAAVEALATPDDELRVEGREVYWLCRGSVARSRVTNARLERAGGSTVTFRSITTVRRLVELS